VYSWHMTKVEKLERAGWRALVLDCHAC